jgi:hypothetical protein
MSTQVIEFTTPSGLSGITAKLFNMGTDTQVGSTANCTERTNKKGFYNFTVSGLAGTYDLVVYYGATMIVVDQVVLQNVDGTYQVNSLLIRGNGNYTVAIPASLDSYGVDASEIVQYRGTTWNINIGSLGTLTGLTQLWFTVRKNADDTDANSLLQVALSGGLLVFNGASVSSSLGSITVVDYSLGEIDITISPSATVDAPVRDNYNYDIKAVIAGVTSMLSIGENRFIVRKDITRKIA